MSFIVQHIASIDTLSTAIFAPEAPNTLIETPRQSKSLLFIDSGVDDIQTLTQGAVVGTEVHVLQGGQDAISQITQTLLGRSGIESVQIVSHGKSGGIELGSSWLDLQTLPTYVAQMKSWGNVLSENADILLYGCNVAQGAAGQGFVNLLAQITGADVAASDDVTGKDGDWNLEFNTGRIESNLGFQVATMQSYNSSLLNVGYYDMSLGQGNSTQLQPITTAGHTGVLLTDLTSADLSNIQILFVQNPSNGDYGSEYLSRLSSINTAVSNGLVLVIHDRYVTDAETILPNVVALGDFVTRSTSDDVKFVDNTTLVTNGPGGSLDDSSLDQLGSSTHGYAIDVANLPSGRTILSTDISSQSVLFSYKSGSGSVVYSASPLDYALDANIPNWQNIYAPNVVAYAASLFNPNLAPTLSISSAPLGYTENATAILLDAAATVTDSDSPNFNTGTLTVNYTAGGTADDRLAIRNQGSGTGQIGVSGSNVTYEGVTIGTFTGGIGTTDLVITFNANATQTAATALLRNLAYENVSDDPSTVDRTIQLIITDGSGGTSTAVSKTIQVTAIAANLNLTNISTLANQSIAQWATDLTASNYPAGSSYVVSVDRPELFDVLPSISPNGTLTYTPKAGLQINQNVIFTVQIQQPNGTIDPAATATLNFKYKPEALVRNTASNEVALLYVDQVTQLQAQRTLTYGASFGAKAGEAFTITQDWAIADTADFDRNGIADILLHSQSGDEVMLAMMGNEGQVMSMQFLTGQDGQVLKTKNLNWKVVSFTDIDRDNILDIVLHNQQSDEIGFWCMNSDGKSVKSYDYFRDGNGNILKTKNPLWRLTDVADFDGDGDADLLFRLPELNQTAIVRLDGKAFIDYQYITANADPTLVIRGVGDANGDRSADIYWQTPDNQKVLVQSVNFSSAWLTDTFKSIASTALLQGIGDLDWNNTADLLFQDPSTNGLAIAIVNPNDLNPVGNLQSGSASFTFSGSNWKIERMDEFGDIAAVFA